MEIIYKGHEEPFLSVDMITAHPVEGITLYGLQNNPIPWIETETRFETLYKRDVSWFIDVHKAHHAIYNGRRRVGITYLWR